MAFSSGFMAPETSSKKWTRPASAFLFLLPVPRLHVRRDESRGIAERQRAHRSPWLRWIPCWSVRGRGKKDTKREKEKSEEEEEKNLNEPGKLWTSLSSFSCCLSASCSPGQIEQIFNIFFLQLRTCLLPLVSSSPFAVGGIFPFLSVDGCLRSLWWDFRKARNSTEKWNWLTRRWSWFWGPLKPEGIVRNSHDLAQIRQKPSKLFVWKAEFNFLHNVCKVSKFIKVPSSEAFLRIFSFSQRDNFITQK